MEKTPEYPLEMLQRLQRQHAEKARADGRAWPGREEVAGAGWIARRTVANRPLVTALRERLDPGEAETIALAVQEAGFYLSDRVIRDARAFCGEA